MIIAMKVKSLSCVRLFGTPWTVPARLLHPWDFPGKITGVGCHFLLQGIFAARGSNLTFLHCSLPGSSAHGVSQARIPEWVAISFSRGTS